MKKRRKPIGSEGSDPRSLSPSPIRHASSTPGSANSIWAKESNELNHSLRGGIVFNDA